MARPPQQMDQRVAWTAPRLTVISRGSSGENVLSGCKTGVGYGDVNPQNLNVQCIADDDVCAACLEWVGAS